MTGQTYDKIGGGYTKHRRADRRIVCQVCDLIGLGAGSRVVDLGAGTGNYSKALAEKGYRVLALEPSGVMRSQAVPHPGVNWIAGCAEHLPLGSGTADGVVCLLASHHFRSLPAAVEEMQRVCPAGKIVWLTFDPREGETPWLREYFPGIWHRAHEIFPPIRDVCRLLRRPEAVSFCLPHDLEDCFMASAWRRPWMYLDPEVRSGMSAFALADSREVASGLARLEADLRSGRWHQEQQDLMRRDAVDWGYRFIIDGG